MTLNGLVMQAYPSPEWAVFFEVSNSTGSHAIRQADAVALGVWPSRGHMLIGFEFKEDRRDWLREKANPAKAETVATHCDCWWVVAGADSVVKVEELPEPWGLYVASQDRTRLLIKKPCQPFPDRNKHIMQRSFAAAMLRKIGETMVPRAEVARLIEVGVKDGLERTRDGRKMKWLEQEVERLKSVIDGFKTATGVDLKGWQGTTKIASAVDAVLNMDSNRQHLEDAATRLELSAANVREALSLWPNCDRKCETAN